MKKIPPNSIKSFVFAFALLFATTAILAQKKPTFDKAVFDQGKMAYVVLSASNNVANSNVPIVSNLFYFKNIQNKKKYLLKLDSIQSFMIPSGDYILTAYRLSGKHYLGGGVALSGSRYQSTAYIDYEFDKSLIECHFSVLAGETVYLGHVIFYGKDMRSPYMIRNDYSTNIIDDFDTLNKKKFELECGKPLISRIMTWNKLK